MRAVLDARRHRYVMLHLAPERIDDLRAIFTGLAAPTVLPLNERTDLVAVHLVVDASEFWTRLGDLRAIGASGIVALPADALAR
jgi:ATP phosphoribosyltransferase